MLGTCLVALGTLAELDAMTGAGLVRFCLKTAVLCISVVILLSVAGGLAIVRRFIQQRSSGTPSLPSVHD